MNKLLVIVGPTAVGKTALSIKAAKQFSGEIISGDSMQVYRQLDIGTAKVTEEEMCGIPHYMIDIVEPTERFTVADFKKRVHKHIKDIQSRGKLPILVGGSGLYVQSILYSYNFLEHKRNDEITKELEAELVSRGADYLYKKLETIDPDQAKKIHKNNHRRLIRALEIFRSTNKTMSSYLKEKEASKQINYDAHIIGLEMERNLLYDRINKRVDQMVKEGLIEETQYLYENGLLQNDALQAIGYKELIPYLKQEMSKQSAIELLKRNSRRFAKRQFTWFKNKLPVNWYNIHPDSLEEDFDLILHDIAGLIKNN